jgi:hypothetical protein
MLHNQTSAWRPAHLVWWPSSIHRLGWSQARHAVAAGASIQLIQSSEYEFARSTGTVKGCAAGNTRSKVISTT